MLKSEHSKKSAIGVLSFLLILVIATCFLIHSNFLGNLFGPPQYVAVELADGETWYGQIASENAESITLSHVYHFHDNNSTQLISHDDRLDPPKTITRSEIFSLATLSESSPVLKAIRKYESK
ncbi:MAG: hypothetical protein WCV72_01700 [Patescibacteria group bacterium]|jgi:hypothetical protein